MHCERTAAMPPGNEGSTEIPNLFSEKYFTQIANYVPGSKILILGEQDFSYSLISAVCLAVMESAAKGQERHDVCLAENTTIIDARVMNTTMIAFWMCYLSCVFIGDVHPCSISISIASSGLRGQISIAPSRT